MHRWCLRLCLLGIPAGMLFASEHNTTPKNYYYIILFQKYFLKAAISILTSFLFLSRIIELNTYIGSVQNAATIITPFVVKSVLLLLLFLFVFETYRSEAKNTTISWDIVSRHENDKQKYIITRGNFTRCRRIAIWLSTYCRHIMPFP